MNKFLLIPKMDYFKDNVYKCLTCVFQKLKFAVSKAVFKSLHTFVIKIFDLMVHKYCALRL